MKFVIQRVNHASLSIDRKERAHIEKGLLVFIGISETDTKEIADVMVRKLTHMRIFEDEDGKTNLDLQAVSGNILLVSQFTLYANCKKGNRPSFTHAAKPDLAIPLYEYIIENVRDVFPDVQTGEFGADMKIELLNDGPFTIVLDSEQL